jgi:hypothetical protein
MQGTPVVSDVFTRSQHSARVTAAGTSTPGRFPARIAATAIDACQRQGVAMITASTSSRRTSVS